MIADAFFSFLNWLRLLFFNREMELALIGGRIVYFYGEQCLFYIIVHFLLLLLLLLLLKPRGSRAMSARFFLRSRLNECAREEGRDLFARAFLFWFPK
jgi:hypothetical protein